jgi:1-acyl-sn-glycerol-3-phosphate acyltransferase
MPTRAPREAGVPLIPAGIAGTDRLCRLAQLKVRYGPAIPLDDIRDDPEAARLATDRLMAAIADLEASL